GGTPMMRLFATGVLIADPQSREGAKGPFTTATIRVDDGDEPVLVSVIAFGDNASRLLEFAKGHPLAVSGRARLTAWNGSDGEPRRGISVIVQETAALGPRARNARPNGQNAHKTRRQGHAYPQHKFARDPVPELPSDSVADVYADIVP